jgi:5-(carboxyamino)imidazole ribonucleotide synthase
VILPGATLGVLGGGQLGRMFTIAARTMGYQVMVLDPDPLSPAGQMADVHLQADYDDQRALRHMGESCAAVTTEFENVPAASLMELAAQCPVRPSADAVAIVQDRSHEKDWLRKQGFHAAPFAIVAGAGDIDAAMDEVGAPALLKVSRFGYDGKGQFRVQSREECRAAFASLNREICVLERLLDLEQELSVVLGRNDSGEVALYPVAENRHRNGILDVSIVPGRVDDAVAERARDTAAAIAHGLNYCGVMAVEFFVLADGSLAVNEIAPRPHNSGHYTLDACATSQFEQQVRMLCGLPPGDTRLLSPVVMVNLLGDIWRPQPDWATLLSNPDIKLHLYGKAAARPGRKMGHYNCLAESLEAAVALADRTRAELGIPGD